MSSRSRARNPQPTFPIHQRSPGPRRCFLYARVSTNEQADSGTSLQAQEEHGRQFCAGEGYPDPEVRIEVESAGEEKIERRVELKRILDEIRPGDVLVCRDLSRWSRDQVFAVQSIRQLRNKGVTVRFWTQLFLDAQTGGSSAPVDLTGIIAWAAENERRMIRERTHVNRKRLRAKGEFVEGHPPFGYKVENRKLVPIPELAPIVQRIFEECLNGRTIRNIACMLRVEYPSVLFGHKKSRLMRWSVGFVRALLRCRMYTGYTSTMSIPERKAAGYREGTWQKTHEAIVSVGIFEQAAQALKGRRRAVHPQGQATQTRDHLLKHVMVCGECGYRVHCHTRTLNRPRRKIGLYWCCSRTDPAEFWEGVRCSNRKTALQKDVDAMAETMLLNRLDELVFALSQHSAPRKSISPDWAKLGAQLAERRARVVRLLVHEKINENDAAHQLAELEGEQGALEARRLAAEREESRDTEQARRAAFSKLTSYREIYKNLSIDERRSLLLELAQSVKLTTEGKPEILWRELPAVAVHLGSPARESRL